MRTIALFILLFAATAGAAPLDELIAIALRDNPQIQAARQAASAAAAVPAQASSFDDPQAGVAWYLSEVETRVGPQEQRLFLSQKLPFWGKRGLRGAHAGGLARAAGATVRDVALAVVTEVKERYYDLVYVEESIRITEADRALVKDIVAAALAHYGAGHGQQRDVLRAQVALSRDTDRLLTLRAQRATLTAILNELLARDKQTPIDGVALPAALPVVETMDGLRDEMVATRPRLAALTRRIEAARAVVDLARKQYYPDLTARFDYTLTSEGPLPVADNGTDSYWATLSINLPIWRKRLDAGVSEARARLAEAEAVYRDELERAERELADLRFRLTTSLEQVALFDTGLVPQAEQALRATMDGYRTGQAEFLNLLDAERDWLDLKLAAFRAKADLFQEQARLDQAVGRLPEPKKD
ncbi:MAG: hypothetical protein AUK30_03395 [Nitrospirae bacterium CG2_30_70_394]|nr:MAG: hypothetical protein AUK30_03395 [Nitrospirae bacterium CG2_30_70_394]